MSRSSGCPGSLKARPGVVFHMISADFTKLFHAFVRPLFELRALTAAQRQLEFSFWAARCRRGRGSPEGDQCRPQADARGAARAQLPDAAGGSGHAHAEPGDAAGRPAAPVSDGRQADAAAGQGIRLARGRSGQICCQ